jgi:hypothetical protein
MHQIVSARWRQASNAVASFHWVLLAAAGDADPGHSQVMHFATHMPYIC